MSIERGEGMEACTLCNMWIFILKINFKRAVFFFYKGKVYVTSLQIQNNINNNNTYKKASSERE